MSTIKRNFWKPLAVLVTVLVVGVGPVCFMVGKPQERRTVVGYTDPVSGYRCRFTLARDWKSTVGKPHETASRSALDMFVLAPGPKWRWIETHVLHRQLIYPQIISLIVGPLHPRDVAFHVVKGYPELTPTSQSRMIAYQHLHVDGFPATFVSADEGIGRQRFHRTVLLVFVPNHSMLYVVLGNGEVAVDREMQEIVASFHVEKVVPVGGVR